MKTGKKVIFTLFLILLALPFFGQANPATSIKVTHSDRITLAPHGEAYFEAELDIPLAHFIFLGPRNSNSTHKYITFTVDRNSGLVIERLVKPMGKEYQNDFILGGKGKFTMVIKDQKGLQPGSSLTVPLEIDLQIASPSKTYAPYTIRRNLNVRVTGTPVNEQNTTTTTTTTVVTEAAEKRIKWHPSYEEALKDASGTKQRIFLYFDVAEGKCGDCDWMENNTFKNSIVKELIADGFVAARIPHKLNGKDNPDLDRFKIQAFPAVVIADNPGKIHYRNIGKVPANELISVLKKYYKASASIQPVATNPPPPTNPPAPKPTPRMIALSNAIRRVSAVLHYKPGLSIWFLQTGEYIEAPPHSTEGSAEIHDISNVTWPGLESYRTRITAAVNWGNGKAYLFTSDGMYLRVNLEDRRVDSGYPKPVDVQAWPGLEPFKNKIIGAASWKMNKIFFFLDDGRYLRYDKGSKKIENGYPKVINNGTWPGMQSYSQSIRAVTNGEQGIAYFYLDGGMIIAYDIEQNKVIKTAGTTFP